VRRHDQPTAFGGILQEHTTNPPSFHWIDAPRGRQCGIEHLQRAVDRVAAEDSRHGALYPYPQLPGRVTRQRQQREAPPEIVAIVNKLHLPGVENRQDAVLKAGQLYGIAAGLAVLLLPILELAPAHEIARVGKGRHPPTVAQARVPADMIDVKVGAKHNVHRLWPDARLFQAVEKAAPLAPMELRNERTLLFLADAAVEQDRPSGRVEHEGLDGEDQSPPRRVQVVRVEQGTGRFDRARLDPGRKPAIESSNRSMSTTTSTALSPTRNRITYGTENTADERSGRKSEGESDMNPGGSS